MPKWAMIDRSCYWKPTWSLKWYWAFFRFRKFNTQCRLRVVSRFSLWRRKQNRQTCALIADLQWADRHRLIFYCKNASSYNMCTVPTRARFVWQQCDLSDFARLARFARYSKLNDIMFDGGLWLYGLRRACGVMCMRVDYSHERKEE